MWFVLSLIGLVVVLVAWMGVIDFRRRRLGRHTGVDAAAARNERRKNEADLRMRSNDQNYGSFGGF